MMNVKEKTEALNKLTEKLNGYISSLEGRKTIEQTNNVAARMSYAMAEDIINKYNGMSEAGEDEAVAMPERDQIDSMYFAVKRIEDKLSETGGWQKAEEAGLTIDHFHAFDAHIDMLIEAKEMLRSTENAFYNISSRTGSLLAENTHLIDNIDLDTGLRDEERLFAFNGSYILVTSDDEDHFAEPVTKEQLEYYINNIETVYNANEVELFVDAHRERPAPQIEEPVRV